MENENADQARTSNFTATSTRSTPEETVHIEYFEVPLEGASGGLIASVANQVSNSHSDVQSPITTGILTERECQRREEHLCLNRNQHQVYSSPQPSTNEDLCSRQDQDQAEDSDSNDEEGISVDELKQTDGYRLFVEALKAHSTKE